jgi:hypothetical protein
VLGSAPVEALSRQSRVWPLAPSPPETWLNLYRSVAGLARADWPAVVARSAWWLLACAAVLGLVGLLRARVPVARPWFPTLALLAVVLAWWAIGRFRTPGTFEPASLSVAVAILAVCLALPRRTEAPHRALIAFGVFSVLVGARAIFSAERSGSYSGIAHFVPAWIWVALLCGLVPEVVPGSPKAAAWTRRAWTATLIVVASIGLVEGVRSLAEPAKVAVQTRQGRIFVGPEKARFFQAIGENLRENERVWVLPEVNGVDALFRVRNASIYPSHLPGWLDDDAQRELIGRMETDRPDAVIVFTRDVREYGVADFGNGYDRLLADWIDRNYRVVVRMKAGRILRKSAAGSE